MVSRIFSGNQNGIVSKLHMEIPLPKCSTTGGGHLDKHLPRAPFLSAETVALPDGDSSHRIGIALPPTTGGVT